MIKVLFICHGRGFGVSAGRLLRGKSRQIAAIENKSTTVLLRFGRVKNYMIFTRSWTVVIDSFG